MQNRVRTCIPDDCTTGFRETRPCTVGLCPTKCPPYHLMSLEKHKGETMQAIFKVDKANIIVGDFKR